MTNYNHIGSTFWPSREEDLNITKKLPVGTYIVAFDQFKGRYYFQQEKNFSQPKKIYGDTMARVDRIINTFNLRPASTGVILAGEKGSGKTLLSKMLSVELAKNDIPTIIVNQAFYGDAFNQLIASVDQPAYILFDEFEKVYNDNDAQNALLTLFDGLYTTKKLFAITSNEKYKINEYMLNRPGRFFYAFTYSGLSEDFIREYLADNLINKDQIESFVRYTSVFPAFSFDMLQAIVEEMNRYNESIIEALKYVNVAPSYVDRHMYKIISATRTKPIPNFVNEFEFIGNANSFNPFLHTVNYSVNVLEKDGDDEWEDGLHVTRFTPNDIKKYEGNRVTYSNGDATVVVERYEDKKFDLHNLL